MSASLKDQLRAVYAARRHAAETARDVRVAQYHATYPELVQLNQKISDAGTALLYASLDAQDPDGPTEARDTAAATLEALEAQRHAWLDAHDLDPHYEAPAYQCTTCDDRGEVDGAACPDCYMQTWVPVLFASEEMHALPIGSFETFDLGVFREATEATDQGVSPRARMTQIHAYTQQWAASFAEATKDLTFVGRPGTGKSFTAAAILRAVLAQGVPAIYQTASGFFEIIRAYRMQQQSFRPDPDTYAAAKAKFDALYRIPLLIIDDLGRESHPRQSLAELLEVLDRRHQANVRTVIVSNLEFRDLAQTYDERLTSRLGGHSTFIPFPGHRAGDDLRLKPKR